MPGWLRTLTPAEAIHMDWFPPYFDGTLREHYLLLFSIAGAIALVTGFVAACIGAHFGARRAVRRALRTERARELSLGVADRLERLSAAVDAIAIEVERISEAQRFAARLLAERPSTPPPLHPRRDASEVTPH
jgi:hypothetical protein